MSAWWRNVAPPEARLSVAATWEGEELVGRALLVAAALLLTFGAC